MKPFLYSVASLLRLQCVNWWVDLPELLSQPVEESIGDMLGDCRSREKCSSSSVCQSDGDTAPQLAGVHIATSEQSLFWWHIAFDIMLLIFCCPKLVRRWGRLEATREQNIATDEQISPSSENNIDSELMQLEHALQKLVTLAKDVNSKDVLSLQEYLERLVSTITKAEDIGSDSLDLVRARHERRRLHNMLLDLKGCVRVFCRIRPLLSEERLAGEDKILEARDNMTVEFVDGPRFHFDAAFDPGTQEQIFEECKGLLQSVVDGYNVAFFTYGQTGAGKTFTMYGDSCSEGIAPRAIKELFSMIRESECQRHYSVGAQFVEIYRNTILDLSSSSRCQLPNSTLGFAQGQSTKEMQHIETEEDLLALLAQGQMLRKTCATAVNSQSSRSHLALIVNVASVDKTKGDRLNGKFLLCDLAGSERLKKSKVTGDHQKEAIEVNKSLTALFDVLESLAKKGMRKVIPYRNSKLTQLLKEALGGDSKTLMFVNCSPASSHKQETIASLMRATRVKKITNAPKRCSLPAKVVEAIE